jgi:hypothetical protein
MTIGLIGEDPNDTLAMANLLGRQFPQLAFVRLLRNLTGSMLDNQANLNRLRREFEEEKPDWVLCIRDLDSVKTQTNFAQKKRERQAFFAKCNRLTDQKAIRLLHIYEIEALLLADFTLVKAEFKLETDFMGDPMLVSEPKEWLKRATGHRYHEGQNPALFGKLDVGRLTANCRYFNRFYREFAKKAAQAPALP